MKEPESNSDQERISESSTSNPNAPDITDGEKLNQELRETIKKMTTQVNLDNSETKSE